MVYEYACVECQHEWEAEQRITEDPLRQCPACGKNTAKRLVTGGAGFLLKGSGWYSDLYGLKTGGAKDSGEGNASKKPSAASATSSADGEKKPASDTSSTKGSTETPRKDGKAAAAA